MPDIKSALSAALLRAPNPVVQQTLNEWDDEGAGAPVIVNKTKGTFMLSEKPARKRGGVIKNNVMRETFDFIMNNPGLTCKMIAVCMEKKGFKSSSVTSVVSQLYRSGQLIKKDSTYFTAVSEYKPMGTTPTAKINRLKKRVEELKVVARSKGITDLPHIPAQNPKEGIAALTPEPAPELPKYRPRPETSHVKPFDPKAILDPLTVYQARALYNELHSMFGA